MYIFHIYILPILFYKLALRNYSISCQGLIQVQIFQCTSLAFASQGHKDFDHNENDLIYSKTIQVSGK